MGDEKQQCQEVSLKMRNKITKRLGSLFLSAALLLPAAAGAFAVEPQAQIGTTQYTTLWEALEKVQDGQTIEILRDISNEELTLFCSCEASFNITIDLNDHTIYESTTNSPGFSYIAGGGSVAPKVTIRDGTIRCTSKATVGSPYASGIWVESMDRTCRPVLVLDNMTISSTNDAGVNCIDAQVNVMGAAISAYDDAIYAQDGPVYIQAGNFYTPNDVSKNGALVAKNKATISMTAQDGIIRPENWQQQKSTLVRAIWFKDVRPYDWFYDKVYDMTRRGLISGKNSWTFGSLDSITRAEAVTLLAAASGQDVSKYSASAMFYDVDPNSWYNHYIGWAVSNGIANGYGYGAFGPNDTITREQLAVMLYSYQNKIMKKDVVETVTPSEMPDADQISDWAQTAMDAMMREGIISGDLGQDDVVRINPQAEATRAQAACMLYQLLALA